MDADAVGHEPPAARSVPAPPARRVRDAEATLLGLLAAGGALAAWACGSGTGPWTATATVAVLAVSARLARWRDPRPPAFMVRAARASLALAAAAVAVRGPVHPSPFALAWFPAVCAVYTVLLPAAAAATLTTAALGVLALLAYDAADAAAAARTSPATATAFAACAVAVVAVSLAGRTVRAVLAARHAVPPLADRVATPDAGPAASPSTDRLDADVSGRDPVTDAPRVAPPPADARRPGRQQSPATRAVPPTPAGVPGRPQLLDALTRAQQRAGVVGGSIAVLVVTVDGAEGLSTSLGEGGARDALGTLARRARAWLPAGDVVAWLGDGRFAVLLEGVDGRTCAVVARRLAGLLAEPVEVGREVVSLSCGVALALAADAASMPAERPEDLLTRAERAPRLAADTGNSPAAPPPQAAVPDADDLGEQLWAALGAGQIGVALQPVVALGTLPRLDRVVAFEALARWTRPDGVSVPPARFVAAGRRSGLADLLGATVLARGLDAVGRRRAAGEPALGLSVNVAPEQLTGAGFATAVLQALETRGIEPGALTLEVPAGASLDDAGVARSSLAALLAAGLGVVLDNFGATGLSIAALRDLPLTGVKLDRSLTADLGADDRLVVATVRLTTRLGLTCTAVGVETQAQLDAARALGIDAVQGHLIGRPEADAPSPVSARAETPSLVSAGADASPAVATPTSTAGAAGSNARAGA